MKTKLLTILALTVLMISSTFTMVSAESGMIITDDEAVTSEADFTVSDISGGKQIINGQEYEMTKAEAQQAYLDDLNFQSKPIVDVDTGISPRIVVSTKISSHQITTGTNRRLTPIYNNKTSQPIPKTASGSYTWTASLTTGIDADKVISAANSALSVNLSYTKTKSTSTTVTIMPGEKFYVTFTPKYVKVTGSQIISAHGASTTKQFSGTFPKIVGGQMDGNIFYVTKKI